MKKMGRMMKERQKKKSTNQNQLRIIGSSMRNEKKSKRMTKSEKSRRRY
jgi:hypothetical protein